MEELAREQSAIEEESKKVEAHIRELMALSEGMLVIFHLCLLDHIDNKLNNRCTDPRQYIVFVHGTVFFPPKCFAVLLSVYIIYLLI